MSETTPELFASRKRAVVIAPAGYGKTHLIAQAVGCQSGGRQLILTHTHAGVRSLLDKLKMLGISSRLYSVETISGFALKYAASFPQSSGLSASMPVAKQWDEVVEPATKIVRSSSGKRILQSSYAGIYVDEYQDCTLNQHELIKQLAEILPCRIVGDPLQGIFDFEDSPPVGWTMDILPYFERLPDLAIPWRWQDGNMELGNWLLEVRECLLNGKSIDLQGAPRAVTHCDKSRQYQIGICKKMLGRQGSVIAIHRMPPQAHQLASLLKGRFKSMEEVEGKDLLKKAEKIERASGRGKAIEIIDFAALCMTGVKTEMKTIRGRLTKESGRIEEGITKNREIAVALRHVVDSNNMASCLEAFLAFDRLGGCHLYRSELWYDMKKTIKEWLTGKYSSLSEAAWKVRDRGRVWGRAVPYRSVSRTLLVKGLEFQHAIVLDADILTTKELYVAMTRGSESLTILSSSPILHRDIPEV
jgi:DNA helicase-2/ATP-dependent DNA helicase PcrA